MAKFLKILIFTSGLLCLTAFIAIRTNQGINIFFDDSFDYRGDLYTPVSVSHFDERLPAIIKERNEYGEYDLYRSKTKHPSIDSAQIITVGDSYFFFPRFTTFPEKLNDKLGKPVFYGNHPNPYQILINEGFKPKDSVISMIYEVGERGVYTRFMKQFKTQPKPSKNIQKRPLFRKMKKDEAEKRYTRLLQKSIFSHNVYRVVNTFKFDHFGYISDQSPVFSQDPPMLFFQTTVNKEPGSILYDYSNHELETIAKNLKELSINLKSLYNIHFIFLPIPSKISIYHKYTSIGHYNNFLPLLFDKLDSLGVDYIDLYEPFSSHDKSDLLYYKTDTHWNEKGVDLAIEVTANKFNEYD